MNQLGADASPLHVVVDGTGPAVLMTAGLGLCSFDWDALVAVLATEAPPLTLIRFDRPGLGASPPGARPSLEGEAERIAGLVLELGLSAPVLVAHSVAAFHAEACALLWPGLLGGLVLVDPSCEEPRFRRRRSVGQARRGGRALPAAARLLETAGLARRIGPRLRTMLAARQSTSRRDITPPDRVLEAYGTGSALVAVLAEYASYRAMAERLTVLRGEHAVPGLPVTVLSATGGMTRKSADRWIHCHAELAARFPRGRQIIAADSGHLVQVDRPDLIASAVLELLPPRLPAVPE